MNTSVRVAENELILNCVRASMEPAASKRVLDLTAGALDWKYVLEISFRHAVGPLLYRSLSTVDRHAAPPWVMKRLQEHFYHNLAHNLRLERELATLLSQFRMHGIPAIPFKGPALAESVYGNSALRVFGDLDILIQKENVQRVAEVMTSIGYQPDVQLEPAQLAAYVDTFYELSFNSAGKAPVEIHWEIYADHFAFPVAPLSIWHDQPECKCESGYWSVPPEKLFLMLCVHGTQHYWERLNWICDIAELLRKHRDFDWESLIKMATETGGLRMLFLGLSLAHELLDTPLPDKILHRIEEEGAIENSVQIIRRRLFELRAEPPGILETCLFYVRIRERFRDKARVFFRTFSRPVPGEWEKLGFDGFWVRLNNVIRHLLIGFGYGLGLAKQQLRKVSTNEGRG